jgi:uncharacterized membrane protein YedE/YeeE
MHWTIDGSNDPLDLAPEDLTIRSGLLPAARGCLFALPLGAALWGMLFGIGWLLAGMRWP